MKNKIIIITLLIFGLLFTGSLFAGEEEKGNFWGSFMLGYRNVNVDGDMNKYQEDYNLETGPRLFGFNLHYVPEGTVKKLFDRFDLTVHNFGGDPFETFFMSIVKYGKYKFNYNRRKSNYFYNDHYVGHDMHHYNFDRIVDTANLKVFLNKKANFIVDFNRYTKDGHRTTSFDITHDEFIFDTKVEESSYDIGVAFEYILDRISFTIEERYQDYSNNVDMHLPGASIGDNTTNLATLDYYYLMQPFSFTNWSHNIRVNARPTDSFLINGTVTLNDQDLNLDYRSYAAGTDYNGSPLLYDGTGEGTLNRKMQLVDLDLSYLFSHNFAAVAAIRYNNLDQDGKATTAGTDEGGDWSGTADTAFGISTLGLEAGLQYQATSKVGITAGFRSESRDVSTTLEGDTHEVTTKRTGLFGNLKLKLSKDFSFTADYQMGTYTDPYTYIGPEDFTRLRLTTKYSTKGFYAKGSYTMKKSETSTPSTWTGDRNWLNLRAGYHGKKFGLSAGYTLFDVEHMGSRDITYYGPATWDILYEGSSTMIDAHAAFYPTKNWKFGAYLLSYKNTGSFEVNRFTGQAWIEYLCDTGLTVKLSYKYVDFDERELEDVTWMDGEAYTAGIFSLGVGYRW